MGNDQGSDFNPIEHRLEPRVSSSILESCVKMLKGGTTWGFYEVGV